MDKHWLSQLLDDSAFPLIVLAATVSHMKFGPYHQRARLEGKQQSIEFRLHQRSGPISGNTSSVLPTWSFPVPTRIRSPKESDHYRK
jgi:hypothetical protein